MSAIHDIFQNYNRFILWMFAYNSRTIFIHKIYFCEIELGFK